MVLDPNAVLQVQYDLYFVLSFSKYTTDFMKSYEKKGMETGT